MGHGHNHTHDHNLHGKNLLFSILLNCAITVSQVIGGIVSGSLSLLSDALHNFSDVLSLVFSYGAHRLSYKKATQRQTFGYKRAEILAAFVNASTVVFAPTLKTAKGRALMYERKGVVSASSRVVVFSGDAPASGNEAGNCRGSGKRGDTPSESSGVRRV